MKYITKPIVKDAVQFKGFPDDEGPMDFRFSGLIEDVLVRGFEDPPDWLIEAFKNKSLAFFHTIDGWTVAMTTSNGNDVSAFKGQWIIKEMSRDGFYPCDDETFQQNYDPYTETD